MNETYATIRFGREGGNAGRLGALVAWLVTNNLLSPDLEQLHGNAVARVKMQDLTGPAFLTTVLHGELKAVHLSAEGRRFIERYYLTGQFDIDFEGIEDTGEDEWRRFAAISPRVTAAYRRETAAEAAGGTGAKIIRFPFGRRR